MNIPFKITYNTLLQTVGKVFTAASTIVVIAIITRSFPENVAAVGNYNTILSYVFIFYVFTDFGLNAIFVRETGADPEKQKNYFKNLLGFRLVSSILVAFLATAILAFTNHSSLVKLGIILALGLIITQSFVNTASALFQARIRYGFVLVVDIFWAISNVIFVYLAATNFNSILFVIIAVVLASVTRTVVALYLVRSQLGFLAFAFDTRLWRSIVLAALPIGFVAIFSQFNAQVDKQIVFLSQYKPALNISGEVAAGYYGLAYKIFEVAIVLPTYIMNVGFPLMIRRREESVASLLAFSKNLAAVLILLGVVGLVVGWFLAPWVVGILGVRGFEPSITTTRILLVGFPLFFITPLTLWLAITLNKLREMVFIYGFAAVFNLAANLVTVPQFGYNAAAVITIISELVIFLLSAGVLWMAFRREKL